MQRYEFKLCGLNIAFNSATEAQRVEEAVAFIQKSYDELQIHGSQLGREKLLALLAIKIADDLFELQKEHTRMLEQIEVSEQDTKRTTDRLKEILDLLNYTLDETSLEDTPNAVLNVNLVDSLETTSEKAIDENLVV